MFTKKGLSQTSRLVHTKGNQLKIKKYKPIMKQMNLLRLSFLLIIFLRGLLWLEILKRESRPWNLHKWVHYTFFYKSNTLRLIFRYLKIIRLLHPRYHPKIIGDILKNVQKLSASGFVTLMINGNENEAVNEKKITKIRHKKSQAWTWSQIY